MFSGVWAGQYNTTGTNGAFFGYKAGALNTSGSDMTCIGANACGLNTTGKNGVYIGSSAGLNQTTASNLVIIDGFGDRTSAALELSNAPVVIISASTPAVQTVVLNGAVTGFALRRQATVVTTSATLSARCSGSQIIGAGSLSLAFPASPTTAQEIEFLNRGVAFTLTAGSAIIYYASATASASVSIPATSNVTTAIWDGTYWNVR
jgi:hypothetical protein